VTTLLDQLRQRPDTARQSAEQILTRAADEQRDLTPDELAEHCQHVIAEREAADEPTGYATTRSRAARYCGPPDRPTGFAWSGADREQSMEDWARTRGLIPDDQPLSF
jgi:hypothetical protein